MAERCSALVHVCRLETGELAGQTSDDGHGTRVAHLVIVDPVRARPLVVPPGIFRFVRTEIPAQTLFKLALCDADEDDANHVRQIALRLKSPGENHRMIGRLLRLARDGSSVRTRVIQPRVDHVFGLDVGIRDERRDHLLEAFGDVAVFEDRVNEHAFLRSRVKIGDLLKSVNS